MAIGLYIERMRAMLFEKPGQPLRKVDIAVPKPGPGQVLIRVHACAVCRTDLHVIDAELTQPKLPLIPGHEIVGRIEEKGEATRRFKIGDRVGIPWLGWTCGDCAYCRTKQENLCDQAKFTGYTLDGGYADYTASTVRWFDRIPKLSQGGRWETSRYLRLWRGGAYRRSGGKISESRAICVHAVRR